MEQTKKQLLFSVTAQDCEWSTQTASGPGGQHRNRSQTAVRCVHKESGAAGFASEYKSQIQNKRAAFVRMASTQKFKNWHRLESARRMANAQSIEKMLNNAVDHAMNPKNLKIEVKNNQGKWTEEEAICTPKDQSN